MQCQVTTKNVRIFYIGSGKIAGTNSGCIIGAESCIVMSSVTRPNQWNKGGGGREFLEKLWCCVDGGYKKIIWFNFID